MTKRRPLNCSFESWIDGQIRQCQESGGFDKLPGAGKPIEGLDQPYDPDWWIRQKIADEGLNATPRILRVKARVANWKKNLASVYSEWMVRKQLKALNEDIKAANASPLGPLSPLTLLDEQAYVQKWRMHKDQH